jgi:hypothetical protein
LTSIKGIPQTIYDELTIVGCKKLKSLDGIGAVTILICNKNGKRFLKKDVEDVGGTLYLDRVKLK